MKIKIISPVSLPAKKVWRGFDNNLFLALTPKFPPVKLLRFDGSRKGDVVSLELNFLLFKNLWTSHIVDSGETQNSFWFVDEGVELPFFLSNWKHRHIVQAIEKEQCFIIDEIEYKAKGGKVFDLIWYLPLYLQFSARKSLYKKYFKNLVIQ